jgi:hypothetical protein
MMTLMHDERIGYKFGRDTFLARVRIFKDPELSELVLLSEVRQGGGMVEPLVYLHDEVIRRFNVDPDAAAWIWYCPSICHYEFGQGTSNGFPVPPLEVCDGERFCLLEFGCGMASTPIGRAEVEHFTGPLPDVGATPGPRPTSLVDLMRRFHEARVRQAEEPSPDHLRARRDAAKYLASQLGRAGFKAARYHLDLHGEKVIDAMAGGSN